MEEAAGKIRPHDEDGQRRGETDVREPEVEQRDVRRGEQFATACR
jgi:hypothetical protein